MRAVFTCSRAIRRRVREWFLYRTRFIFLERIHGISHPSPQGQAVHQPGIHCGPLYVCTTRVCHVQVSRLYPPIPGDARTRRAPIESNRIEF
jgi:hypothetical protein